MINTTNIISRALIDTTQNLTQSASSAQIVRLSCSGEACNTCLKGVRSVFPDFPKDKLEEVCDFACTCRMDDVALNKVIYLDISTSLIADNEAAFVQHFMDNLVNEAYNNNVGLFNLDNNREVLVKSVTNLYQDMLSSTFQESLTAISSLQSIEFRGPGVVSAVRMELFTEMVSNVIIRSSILTESLQDVESNIEIVIRQTVVAGFERLIEWIVLIIFIIVLGYLSSYFLTSMLKLYNLISRV